MPPTVASRRAFDEVILVHGMWHQPGHFNFLAKSLEALGYRIRVPRLHRGNVAADVSVVQEEIDSCTRPPALLGHSYGGAVIGQTEGACAMLFVAAFVLHIGESCAKMGGPPLLESAIVTNIDGTTTLNPALARQHLFADCPADRADTAVRLLTRQDSGHGRTIAWRESWVEVPTRYVVCGTDQALDVKVQKQMASRCMSKATLRGGHSVYISQPNALAAEISSLSLTAS